MGNLDDDFFMDSSPSTGNKLYINPHILIKSV